MEQGPAAGGCWGLNAVALLLSHWHTAEQNPRMGLWMQPAGKSPNLGNDLGVLDSILAVRNHSIPGVSSRGHTGMVSSLTELGDGTCLLPGWICAATRHHCRELNTPWTAANSSLQIPGMGAKPPSPQLFCRVQCSRKLPQRSSAKCPGPLNTLSRTPVWVTKQLLCWAKTSRCATNTSKKSLLILTACYSEYW